MSPPRLFYEPSALTPLGKNNRCGFKVHAADGGRALRYAMAPRPPAARPEPKVTFLNGRKGDISKWWTHSTSRAG